MKYSVFNNMARKINVAVAGSCMIDFVSYAPRLPDVGETIHGTKFVTNFGGKGANQCVAAAKLGASTALIARVGDDIWGDRYIANLADLKVDTRYVRKTTGHATGIAQILVSQEDGANQIVIVGGANSELGVQDIQSATEVLSCADVVVCQLETTVEIAKETMKLCKGISILNGAPAIGNCDAELLRLPTIFCVNESEASIFSGICITSVSDAKKAIHELFTRYGCTSVVVTLGADGALYAHKDTQDNFVHVSSPTLYSGDTVVDTTGAGDAFVGAMAYLLAVEKDLDIHHVLRLACKAATDSVTRPGTQISFPEAEIFKNEQCLKSH